METDCTCVYACMSRTFNTHHIQCRKKGAPKVNRKFMLNYNSIFYGSLGVPAYMCVYVCVYIHTLTYMLICKLEL